MVRIRTIPKAVAEIKAQDLTSGFCAAGTIKPVKGSYTYTLDELERSLADKKN